MTIVILDPGDMRLPYHDWLGDQDDMVLVTDTVGGEAENTCFREVRYVDDYAGSGLVESHVVDLAGKSNVSGIVAVGHVDQIRAGALREFLGLSGQHRDRALALTDLLVLRNTLTQAGVPTVPSGPVRRAADLYWYGHRWGYPIRVRRRRAENWPVSHTLTNEDNVAAFASRAFTAGFEWLSSLVVEPSVLASAVSDPCDAMAVDIAAALPAPAGYRHVVALSGTDTERAVVDSVVIRPISREALQLAIRRQAGLRADRSVTAG